MFLFSLVRRQKSYLNILLSVFCPDVSTRKHFGRESQYLNLSKPSVYHPGKFKVMSLRAKLFSHVSFRISLRWPIHIINPVDETKLSCYTSHRRSTTVSLETYPSISFTSIVSSDKRGKGERVWDRVGDARDSILMT